MSGPQLSSACEVVELVEASLSFRLSNTKLFLGLMADSAFSSQLLGARIFQALSRASISYSTPFLHALFTRTQWPSPHP